MFPKSHGIVGPKGRDQLFGGVKWLVFFFTTLGRILLIVMSCPIFPYSFVQLSHCPKLLRNRKF